MKKEIKIITLLKFLKYNSFAGKLFAICQALLVVFLSVSLSASQVGNGKDFSEITISEGATIISEDSYFNAQLVDKKIKISNGAYLFVANEVIVIISEDNRANNNHITHYQKRSYQEKKIKHQKSNTEKTVECTTIKHFNDDQVCSIPFLPHNFFRGKYRFTECFIISLYDYKVSLTAILSKFYYSKSFIEDLHHQKYNFENKLLLFLKNDSFFVRPPPEVISFFI